MSAERPTVDQLEHRLREAFPDARVEVGDDSHLHVGHAGAAGGGGHFRVRIVSARFGGLSRIARHRLVYDCLQQWLPQGIHALAIDARTPGEGD